MQNFLPQRQWCINPLTMGPEILYTTGAWDGVNVSVVIFPSSDGGVKNPVSEQSHPVKFS